MEVEECETRKLEIGSKWPEKAAWMTEHKNAQCLPEKLSRMFSRMKHKILRSRTSRLPLSMVMESHSRIVWARVSIVPGKVEKKRLNKRGEEGGRKTERRKMRIMNQTMCHKQPQWRFIETHRQLLSFLTTMGMFDICWNQIASNRQFPQNGMKTFQCVDGTWKQNIWFDERIHVTER